MKNSKEKTYGSIKVQKHNKKQKCNTATNDNH